ncbi:autotransporter outer membrane beta-barrel domain-containing protein, partial [Bartonella acomydis]|uniref:autotransporter outer membrane beta-barrel domain-containing protein n=1 Tax=Bartonella acomydis TaxID=686234 RepID=UPI0031ED4C73
MIDVFKKRTRLYALTTSALFFLQAVDVSMGNGGQEGKESLLTSVDSSSLLKSSPFNDYKCDMTDDKTDREPIFCMDGQEHSMKGGSILVKRYGENALYVMGSLVKGESKERSFLNINTLRQARSIKAKTTTVNVNNVAINGVEFPSDMTDLSDSSDDSDDNLGTLLSMFSEEDAKEALVGWGSAVLSVVDAQVNLENSNIQNFVTGLEAVSGGNISMKGGKITKASIGASANEDSSILLENVNIDVKIANILPINAHGLQSVDNSQITMKSGSIIFEKGGVGIISEYGGIVKLENVMINIAQQRDTGIPGSSRARRDSGVDQTPGMVQLSIVFLLQDAHLSSDGVIANGSDAIGLWVSNSDPSENENNFWSNSDYDIQNYNLNNNDDFTKIAGDAGRVLAAIKSSAINLAGNDSYGIYFSEQNLEFGMKEYMDEQEDQARDSRVIRNVIEEAVDDDDDENLMARVVLLESSKLKVPGGVAIYGRDLKGSVILEKDSALSGDVLLRAVDSSNLSVFASDSFLKGAVRIDKDSKADLILSHGSEWYVTKNRYSDSADSNMVCLDSCISSMTLRDSNIRFITSSKNIAENRVTARSPQGDAQGDATGREDIEEGIEYRVLRIGNGNKKEAVYTASGYSRIYFNANLMPSETENSQISDRLLIHGNVDGKTTVFVHDTSVNGQQKKQFKENPLYSTSLIQVFGEANRDSFTLDGGYITRKGAPYKYVLRAYGPTIPRKMQYFDKKLVKDSKDVWDFRLESENIPYECGWSSSCFMVKAPTPIISVSKGTETSEPSASRTVTKTDGEVLDTLGYDVVDEVGNAVTFDSDSDAIDIVAVTGVPSIPSNEGSHGVKSTASKQKGSSPVGRILLVSGNSKPFESVTFTVPNEPAPIVSLASSGTSIKSLADTITNCSVSNGNGEVKSQAPYLCSDGQTHTMKNSVLKTSSDTQHSMHAKSKDTVIKLEGATISGVGLNSRNNVDFKSQFASAVLAEEGAKVILDKKSNITSSVIGLEAQKGGEVKMIEGTVNADYVGALAGSGSSVNLSNTKINMVGGSAAAGLASKGGKIIMDSGTIILKNGVAVRSEDGGSVKLDKVNITAKKEAEKSNSTDKFGRAAILVSDNASVEFTNGDVITDANALWVKGTGRVVENSFSRKKRSADILPVINHAHIESSTVKVEGDKSYGIYFDGKGLKEVDQQNRNKVPEKVVAESTGKGHSAEKAGIIKRSAESLQERAPIAITGMVSLKKTVFEVAKSVAIYGNNSAGHVSLENKTTLSGDLLLRAENNSNIVLSLDNSIIVGGSSIEKSSYVNLDLANRSEWILKRGEHKNWVASNSECMDSCVSSIRLVNSVIEFVSPESGSLYQTLRIGDGSGKVYAAQRDASISLNARLNPHDSSNEQVTDRLLIHGDIEGKTRIHVRGVSGEVSKSKDHPKVAHSVSIIQVYGKAEKDSFQLDGNYVVLANSPYKYTLRAYGPEVTSKQEHVQQKFMKDGGEFWNFRLENQYVKANIPALGFAGSERFVRSVVPQVPTYLLLPNSIFHAGLMDISNQNKQLEIQRSISGGMLDIGTNSASFLR